MIAIWFIFLKLKKNSNSYNMTNPSAEVKSEEKGVYLGTTGAPIAGIGGTPGSHQEPQWEPP